MREIEPWRQEENERKVVEIKNYLFPNDSNGTKEPLSIGGLRARETFSS